MTWEASRFLISSGRVAGGDLLRASANSLYFKAASNIKILNVPMEAWSEKKKTVGVILKFLFGVEVVDHRTIDAISNHPEWSLAQVDSKPQRLGTSSHVTQHKLTPEERASYRRRLLRDPILGHILGKLVRNYQDLPMTDFREPLPRLSSE